MKHPIDVLLPLLKGVRKSPVPAHWMARCPAHEDKYPSLSIRLFDDGSISVKCFAGCGTGAILHAVGLEPQDLFPKPERYIHTFRPRPQPPPWKEIISYLHKDLTAIQIGAARIAAGDELSDDDLDRLTTAAVRVSELLERVRQ